MMTRRTALSLAAPAAAWGAARRLAVRGMYSSPKAFWEGGRRLSDFGVNALFVGAGSINTPLLERAAAEGARVFAEFPTLNGKGYVEKHPEAWPVNEKGEKAPAATWFLGACPCDPGFRAYRMKQLEELLERQAVAGVWLDYFHWHAQFEEPEPILPETCFSESCIAEFEKSARLRVPAGATAERARFILTRREREWRDWRARRLVEWAEECRQTIARRRKGALLGIFHCPWSDSEFAGARRRILGLDFDRLAGVFDVFSPMVYHGRMGRRPEWVGEHVAWLGKKLRGRAKIWPIVQAQDGPRPVAASEFETVLRLGSAAPCDGVMMFTAQAVASHDGKLEAMRRVYREAE